MSDLLMKMPVPYEPLKKNRFIVRFPSSLGINEFTVASAAKPTISIEEVEIPFLNTSTWVAGRFVWDTVDITFRDPIGPSSTQALMEWIRLCAESVTGRMGYAVGYKKDIEVDVLDPAGVVVQKWVYQGAFITSSNFGELDHSDSGVAEITVTIRFDRAINVY